MDDTGRLRATLPAPIRRITVGKLDPLLRDELPAILAVDRAHLVMLAERGLVPRESARGIVAVADELEGTDAAALRDAAAPRGLYLAYEDLLIGRLGPEVGGTLQLGRSRNDLNATTLRLRLRGPFSRVALNGARLVGGLIRQADRHREVTMPAFTHYQPAVPITLGHYYAALAFALLRDLEWLMDGARDLQRSPLGAAAVGGTAVPVDPARTADLLGFDAPAANSVDAVASRDLVLRLLAASAVLGVTLSRAAADLLLWCTPDLGFMVLPDSLSGSSSNLPQKRNPFLLEHVQGRGTAALGAFAASAGAMHGKPFSNSVAVGTEAVRPLWQALSDTGDAALLLRTVVSGARPCPEAMLRSCERGYTTSAALAERMALSGRWSFREAHHAVGAMVTQAAGEDAPLEAVARRTLGDSLADGLDPASVARANAFGGGPGGDSLEGQLRALREGYARLRLAVGRLRRRWRESDARLREAAASI